MSRSGEISPRNEAGTQPHLFNKHFSLWCVWVVLGLPVKTILHRTHVVALAGECHFV